MNPTETDKTTDKTAGETTGEATGQTAPQSTEPAVTIEKSPADETSRPPADADSGEAAEAIGEVEGVDGTEELTETPRESSGLLSASAAVVAAGLGVVGLSGSWVSRIAAERQTLLGQIQTSQGGSPADQISAMWGDAWHATALVNGIFALLALIVGLTVLTRPNKPGWVRAVAVGGAVLGGIGLLTATGMYFDLILDLPKAG
ncbi:hypothetical protein [Streptomyces sp. NPDC001985]|uniref:hypothetical protein n=1 Tax=Streptomyces sp. NPDC001985 TaxID=3154406 RepID=UPI00331D9E59